MGSFSEFRAESDLIRRTNESSRSRQSNDHGRQNVFMSRV